MTAVYAGAARRSPLPQKDRVLLKGYWSLDEDSGASQGGAGGVAPQPLRLPAAASRPAAEAQPGRVLQ